VKLYEERDKLVENTGSAVKNVSKQS
jgi:hypothetical protein